MTTTILNDPNAPSGTDRLLTGKALTHELPAEIQDASGQRLLLQRMEVARRALAALCVDDDRWVVDERQAPIWSIDTDHPSCVQAKLDICKGAGNPMEPEYTFDELLVQVWFIEGSALLETVDLDSPASGWWSPTFVDNERALLIENEKQALRNVLTGPTGALSASRRRL